VAVSCYPNKHTYCPNSVLLPSYAIPAAPQVQSVTLAAGRRRPAPGLADQARGIAFSTSLSVPNRRHDPVSLNVVSPCPCVVHPRPAGHMAGRYSIHLRARQGQFVGFYISTPCLWFLLSPNTHYSPGIPPGIPGKTGAALGHGATRTTHPPARWYPATEPRYNCYGASAGPIRSDRRAGIRWRDR
jgi:hypothetical protein